MSLDVWLVGPETEVPCVCQCCQHQHMRKTFYDGNITHNLVDMAKAAGICDVLWRPSESGITIARQLIEPLRAGLALLESDPPRFEKFNSPNGWGKYEHFVPFVRLYLAACED